MKSGPLGTGLHSGAAGMEPTDIEDPIRTVTELKVLDSLLRCEICYEYIKTCVITSCSHSFCSLCIRQYMSYKCQCPKCFEETTEGQLRPNRLVDDIVTAYGLLRDSIAKRPFAVEAGPAQPAAVEPLVVHKPVVVEPLVAQEPPVVERRVVRKSPVLATKRRKSPAVKPVLADDCESFPLEVILSNGVENEDRTVNKSIVSKPAASRPPVLNWQDCEAGPSSSSGPRAFVRVGCPVCGVEVPDRTINLHLDKCLSREHGTSSGPKTRRRTSDKGRKPLPKLVYNIMTERDMRKKLKELGLNCKGDKKTMVWRHHRYTLLYNAECDSLNPRPVADILREVEANERKLSAVAGGSSQGILRVDRKANPAVIEEKQKEYLQQNRDHFQQLVSEVKRRKVVAVPEEKPSEPETVNVESDIEDIESVIDDDSEDFPPSSQSAYFSHSQSSDDFEDDPCMKTKKRKAKKR